MAFTFVLVFSDFGYANFWVVAIGENIFNKNRLKRCQHTSLVSLISGRLQFATFLLLRSDRFLVVWFAVQE